MKQKIILIVVLAIVIGSIGYLEFIKPQSAPTVSALQSAQDEIASTTAAIASSSSKTSPGAIANGTSASLGTSQAQLLKARASIIKAKSKLYQAAPEITDPTGFVNTAPFKLSSFVENKVVLLDFWTYSCINCIRTIPYLNAWYDKYKDQGLVIVGIHTPEFDFEHSRDNVSTAAVQYNIKYPIVLDNNQGTWEAYQNLYWPHEFLIDMDGFIVYDHVGEGHYADTEQAIQKVLKERNDALGTNMTVATGTANPSGMITIDPVSVQSPETYFGAERNVMLADGRPLVNGPQTLSATNASGTSRLMLDGTWNFEDQYATNQSANAKIFYTYSAKNVYMVASADQPVNAQVFIDGKPAGSFAGTDVSANGGITIQANKLYNLVNGPSYGTHTIEIIIPSAGLKAYTFTFG